MIIDNFINANFLLKAKGFNESYQGCINFLLIKCPLYFNPGIYAVCFCKQSSNNYLKIFSRHFILIIH